MAGQKFDLVVAANRLPVTRVADGRGGTCWQRSPGGLVSAVGPVMRVREAAWVGWVGEQGPAPRPFHDGGLYLRPVGLSRKDVEQYYEGFSNTSLWPLFHDLVAPAVFHRAWWNSYREVNARFARAVVQVAAPGATLWVHDYHLQLVPRMVRVLRPDLRIGWFDHIPFPPVELFAQLPWRRPVLEGLLGADLVGFQTSGDAENFLRACARLLGLPAGADTVTVPSPAGAVPRAVRVAAVPISVDFKGLDALARSAEAVEASEEFRASLGHPEVLVLALDRLDYTKGIRHRLKAYEELLRDGAVDASTVTFVQSALPSRERIGAYRRLREEVEDMVRLVNSRYSTRRSPAVHLCHEYDPPATVVGMFLAADVMLVTPLRDGMNLVAKEYVACRHDLGGALVLSEFTGAWQELPEAFSCNPHDIERTKRAILSAIGAPEDERRRRMAALRHRVAEHDVQRWASDYLEALDAATARPASSARVRGPG